MRMAGCIRGVRGEGPGGDENCKEYRVDAREIPQGGAGDIRAHA
jgi:hypothetical protein